jgi:hypothetical protein
MNKLDTIRLESVMYDNLPLSEVVRHLADESKKRDPEKRGINFLIHVAQPVVVPQPGVSGPTAMEAVDLNSVSVRLNPPLTNVRLADVLDAIVKVADHPIKYSINDYAVVISLKESDDSPGPVPLPPGYSPR